MKSTIITIAAALLAAPLYAQGFGDIGAGQRTLGDQSSAGGELQLGVGYRVNPYLMIGGYGSGGIHATGDLTSGGNIYTATAGVQANLHFLPSETWDPWIGLGSGWRALWIDRSGGAGTDSRHGIDLARLTAGVDYRVNSQFAVSPYVGAGLTTFLTQELAGQQNFANVHSPDVNVWLFGGIQGRFDLLGSSSSSSMRVASAN